MHILKRISFVIFALFLLGSCAEKYSLKEYGKTRELHYSDYSIKFYLANNDIKIKTSNEVIYTYFQGDRIVRTQGEYDGRLLSGEYKELYTNKSLKQKGAYKKGVKVGEWKKWNEEGLLLEVSNWKEGKLNGSFLKYYKGQLAKEFVYKNNELVVKKEKKKKKEEDKQEPSEPSLQKEEIKQDTIK